MVDLDFFWDPVCPWAWITSRWVHEVIDATEIEVEWRFLSLLVLNEGSAAERRAHYRESHTLGFALLRVAAAVREHHGAQRLGALYTAMGERIHVAGDPGSLRSTAGLAALLGSLDLDPALAAAAETDDFNAAVRADTDLARERAGPDLGTPVLTFGPPDGPSLFGPVISRVPRGEDAIRTWGAVTTLAILPGFAELKRARNQRPDTTF